jgi:hypothetical protein
MDPDSPEWTPEQERIAREERQRAWYLQAIELGELAVLRLRAECLLERGDRGEVRLMDAVRARLDRIAVAPREGDRIFLDEFDRFLED